MFINSNIRYLRKLKRLSQEGFAKKLGLNRGNVASYENNSHPPLDVLLKLSSWYNISTDALLQKDLSKEFTLDTATSMHLVNNSVVVSRIHELMKYIEKDTHSFSEVLSLSFDKVEAICKEEEPLSAEVLYAIVAKFNWLNLDWLLRGEGSMVSGFNHYLSAVAEPAEEQYASESQFETIQNTLNLILARLELLEKKKSV